MSFFRCNTSSGGDLCFNGGTCEFTPEGFQRCKCPPNFGPDTVTFKMANCALPAYALLAMLIANALVTLYGLTQFAREHSTIKERARAILKRAAISIILFTGQTLALYLENGWGTATSVMACLVIAACTYWGIEITDIMIVPLFSMAPRVQAQVRRYTKFGWALLLVINTTTCIALAVTAQRGSDEFNTAMYAYFLGQVATTMLTSASMAYYANELRREVRSHGLADTEDLDGKLRQIWRGSLSFPVAQTPALVGCIMMWAIGSMPFNWGFTIPVFVATPMSVITITMAIFRRSKLSSEATPTNKNRDSKEYETALSPASSVHSLSPTNNTSKVAVSDATA